MKGNKKLTEKYEIICSLIFKLYYLTLPFCKATSKKIKVNHNRYIYKFRKKSNHGNVSLETCSPQGSRVVRERTPE